MKQCKFDISWVGRCSNEADESGFCKEHKGKKCAACGKQAVRDCEQTIGAFVCGRPLCESCRCLH